MPKKKSHESQEQQSARFLAEAEKLIAAGNLDPDEAAKALDKLVRSSFKPHDGSPAT